MQMSRPPPGSCALGSLTWIHPGICPISGQVSERRIDRGNAVTADETVLTTVVSTNPLHFAFDGSEGFAAAIQRQNGSARVGAPVRIRLQDEAHMCTPAGSTSSTMP
jgi:hypothetical protein